MPPGLKYLVSYTFTYRTSGFEKWGGRASPTHASTPHHSDAVTKFREHGEWVFFSLRGVFFLYLPECFVVHLGGVGLCGTDMDDSIHGRSEIPATDLRVWRLFGCHIA